MRENLGADYAAYSVQASPTKNYIAREVYENYSTSLIVKKISLELEQYLLQKPLHLLISYAGDEVILTVQQMKSH